MELAYFREYVFYGLILPVSPKYGLCPSLAGQQK
jgi:hypothetical protein